MSALFAVEAAQARLFALRTPLPDEEISCFKAVGRYSSRDIKALRSQPAAPLSAMDGYAIRFDDLPGPWHIVGEVAAGSAALQPFAAGEACRIFTGALLPPGADTVVVQEDVSADGARLTLTGAGPETRGRHIRAAGGDFGAGDRLVEAGSLLTPGAIAAAIMGGAERIAVGSLPRVAILTTGDELVAPGTPPGPGQIPDSNGAMLAAMLAQQPAQLGDIGHCGDDRRAMSGLIKDLARRHHVIVTVGGASVGDHDHVRGALADAGGRLDFRKIAMRPGKPLIAGIVGDAVLLGLPGNPSSAFVTATLFLLPLVRHLAGARDPLPRVETAPLGAPLGPGGARRDYLRARRVDGTILPLVSQDSGQTLPLAQADALLVREIDAPAAGTGAPATFIAIA